LNVLIADDNAQVRKILEALLSAWGYNIVTASDGKEAWEVLQRPSAPSLVILDWMMPGMDGIQICRSLRLQPPPVPPYIILLTCRGDKEDLVTGLEAGADDFITKPFESDELRARIQVGKRAVELQMTLIERMGELHRQGQELQRSIRALKLLNESNQAITRIENEEELFSSICRIVVESGGYRLAWIGLTEQGTELRLTPRAQYGFEEGALEAMRLSWSDADISRSPVGRALQTGQPAVVRDILNNRQYAYRQVEAASRGFSSLAAIPFSITPQTAGVLSLYAREPDAFDSEEIKLLAKMSNQLAFGISAFRTSQERRRIEAELQVERDQAQRYLDVAGVLMVALDSRGIITLVNAKGCSILGFPQEELLGRDWFTTCAPGNDRDEYVKLMTGKQSFEEYFESTVVTRGGTKRILAVHASLLRDRKGTITGLLFSGEDITERKKTEESLRTSEENYRTLFDRMVSGSRAIAAYRSGGDEG